jgi:hypothetical protein
MTAAELKAYIRTILVALRTKEQEYVAFDAVIDFITQAITSGIPAWTNALTFNLDGSGAGSFCTHPDTNAKLRFWKTKTDGNIGNQPPTAPLTTENTYWIEVSPSDGSAIKEWAAGIYGAGLVIVYHNHSVDGRGFYLLLDPVRPFNSTNIETEITAGKWALVPAKEISHATAAGTDTYTATLAPAITAYATDLKAYIKFTNANTGPATINLNGLGAKSIVKSGTIALEAGDISSGQILCLVYDGANFQVVGGGGGSGSGMAIEATYADVAALLADQANQDEDKWYLVQDASADSTVDAGWAIYQYLGTTAGNLTDYLKIGEQESLDLTISNASETVKGIVEEATDAEVTAGTATGATGAKLFITPAKLLTWWNAIKAAAIVFTSSLKAKQIAGDYGVLTDAANIAWNANSIGNTGQVTLGGNRTLDAITNPQTGGIYVLRVVQDGTGSRTLAFNAAFTFPNSTTSSLVSAISGVTIFAFFYDGTNFRCILSTGTQKFNELHVINQAGASTKKNALLIDDTGKVTKVAWVEHDTTNQIITETGVDDGTTVLREWKNLSGNLIFRLLNDLHGEFGGTSSFWEVNSAIPDGSAGIIFLASKDIAYRFKDGSSFDYIKLKSTTTGYGRATNIAQKQVNDYGQGFETIRDQVKLVLPNTTAATQHIVKAIAIPAGYGIEVHVHNAYALATNKNAQSCNPFKAIAYNDAGTTTGVNDTITMLRQTATTGGFNINYNDTTDELEIRFLNETGTGRQYDVLVDFSYILYPLPV